MDDQQAQGGMGDDGGAMGGGGMGAPPPPMGEPSDMGGDMMGAPGDDGSGALEGQEGSMPTTDMGNADQEVPMEGISKSKPIITEQKEQLDDVFNKYFEILNEHNENKVENGYHRANVYDSDALLINEEFDKMIDALGKFVDDKE